MIKRRFYKMEHGDRDDPSNQSSSSSDSDIQIQPQEDDDAQSCSTSSAGYQSEDSSANEIQVDMSGFPVDEDDANTGNKRQNLISDKVSGISGSELQEKPSDIDDMEPVPADLPEYIVKSKSTFKCRLCPRIVCLNEEALRAHLKSKRHARSEKLLNEGRLKVVLNSDGKLDEEGPAMYARILAQGAPRKKGNREDKMTSRKKRRYDTKKSKERSGKKRRQ